MEQNIKLTKIQIYPDNNERTTNILLSFKLEHTKTYTEIKKKCVELASNHAFERFKLNFKKNDILHFHFKGKYPGIITDGFWDKDTFKYIRERLLFMKKYNEPINFWVEKVDKAPSFAPPIYDKRLEKALACCNKDINNKTKGEMNEMLLNDFMLTYDIENENKEKTKKKEKEEEKKNEEGEEGPTSLIKRHENVMCRNCLIFNPPGKLFLCSECPHDCFFFCEKCQSVFVKEKIHNESHEMIQIMNPIINKVKLEEYDNIIYPNVFYLKKEENEIKFSVVNTGSQDIKKGFIQEVRHGKMFIKCSKEKISEIKKGEKREITLELKKPSNEDEKKEKEGQKNEGYFRMFIKEGLPFGELIRVYYI